MNKPMLDKIEILQYASDDYENISSIFDKVNEIITKVNEIMCVLNQRSDVGKEVLSTKCVNTMRYGNSAEIDTGDVSDCGSKLTRKLGIGLKKE